MCAELVDLRAFHGVTAVPLAAAAALEARRGSAILASRTAQRGHGGTFKLFAISR